MIPYGTRVPVVVRLVANCYTPFTFTCVCCGLFVLRVVDKHLNWRPVDADSTQAAESERFH